MKMAPETLGLCVVVPLIAVGLWYLPTLDPTGPFSSTRDREDPASNASSISSGNQVAWSKDDQMLLVRYRGGNDFESQLALLNLEGELTQSLFENFGADTANAATLFADSRRLLIGTHLGHLFSVDLLSDAEYRPIVDLQKECVISSVAATDEGSLVAGGTSNGKIYVASFDHIPGRDMVVLKSGESQASIGQLRFSRNGEQLLSARNDGRLDLWHVPSRRLLQTFAGHPDVAKGAAFLGDGRRIISVGLDDTVRIWDIEGVHELWRGDFGQEGLHALDVSRDGRLAAWGGNSRRIVVWNLEMGCRRIQIDSPLPAVFDLRFSGDGTRLAAVGRSASVHLFDMHTGDESARLPFDSRRQ